MPNARDQRPRCVPARSKRASGGANYAARAPDARTRHPRTHPRRPGWRSPHACLDDPNAHMDDPNAHMDDPSTHPPVPKWASGGAEHAFAPSNRAPALVPCGVARPWDLVVALRLVEAACRGVGRPSFGEIVARCIFPSNKRAATDRWVLRGTRSRSGWRGVAPHFHPHRKKCHDDRSQAALRQNRRARSRRSPRPSPPSQPRPSPVRRLHRPHLQTRRSRRNVSREIARRSSGSSATSRRWP